MKTQFSRPLAVVTGASSGIGFELAQCCARRGFDLVIAADDPRVEPAAACLRAAGVGAEPVQVDLATMDGVDVLYRATQGRPVDVLIAKAGYGLGNAFLDQALHAARHVVNTNVTGTMALVHRVGRDMREHGRGRILITGSIAGFMPRSYQAVYNASKAFLDSFAYPVREELKDTGVTVTCLMPGATDTEFFAPAGMQDKVGTGSKDDPAEVAKAGFEAMMQGAPGVVTGAKNKVQAALARWLPMTRLASLHAQQAAPGSAALRSSTTGMTGLAALVLGVLARRWRESEDSRASPTDPRVRASGDGAVRRGRYGKASEDTRAGLA